MESTNNIIKLTGKVAETPVYHHELYGEEFYLFKLDVARLSGISDILEVTVSNRLVDVNEIKLDDVITVEGQLRSFNQKDEEANRTHLKLTVFAQSLEPGGNFSDNEVSLTGYVCKAPIKRETPLGRTICDLLIAVNRPYKKSDYVPCVCWGRTANFASDLEVGKKVTLCGRFQSRQYTKKVSPDSEEVKAMTTYEVSINRLFEANEE